MVLIACGPCILLRSIWDSLKVFQILRNALLYLETRFVINGWILLDLPGKAPEAMKTLESAGRNAPLLVELSKGEVALPKYGVGNDLKGSPFDFPLADVCLGLGHSNWPIFLISRTQTFLEIEPRYLQFFETYVSPYLECRRIFLEDQKCVASKSIKII
jgi:hypothetical protein